MEVRKKILFNGGKRESIKEWMKGWMEERKKVLKDG